MTHRNENDMNEAQAVAASTDGDDEVFETLEPSATHSDSATVPELESTAAADKGQGDDTDEGDESDAGPPPGELTSAAQACAIIEGYLFLSNDPLSIERLSKLMNNLDPRTVRGILIELQAQYEQRGGAMQIIEVAGGFQMATRPELAEWMARLQRQRRKSALTPASIETLAIIAYRQPVTRADIEAVRGVDSGAPIRLLQDLGLVDVGGRREVPGRPQLYVTTELFLRTFGLKSLKDLAAISDLKRIFGEQQRLVRKTNKDSQPEPERDGKSNTDQPPAEVSADDTPAAPE